MKSRSSKSVDRSNVPAAVERQVRRIRKPDQVRAARRWLHLHGGRAHPETLIQLASTWANLTRRHGRNWGAQLIFSFFDILAELPPQRLPSEDSIRFLLRSLRRFPQAGPWEHLVRLLTGPGAAEAVESWRSVHGRLAAAERQRLAAKVRFEEMHDELAQFCHFLCGRDAGLVLRQEKMPMDGLTAWTDGKHITLPEEVALAPHPLLNRWAYLRLLAHECEHINGGTFAFRFRTPEGRHLWARLAPRRSVFRRQRAQWDGRQALDRLATAGEPLRDDFQPFLPHLTAFFLHFDNPQAIHGLFNLIEDIRIERNLAEQFPALGEVARILVPYEQALQAHPRLVSPQSNFFRALYARAYGHPSSAHIAGPYAAAWQRVAPILDSWRLGPIGTVADSLHVTLDVVEVLEEHLPKSQQDELNSALGERVQVPVEDVIFRQYLRSPEEYDPTQPSHRGRFPTRPETEPEGPGPWFRYPEWDVWKAALLPNAVWVREQRWKAWRTPHSIGRHFGEGRLAVLPNHQWSSRRRHLQAEGIDLDMTQLHDFQVARRLGRQPDDRIFRVPRTGRGPGWAVTFVVDLTVSLEAPRGRADGSLPLVRALAAVQALAARLQRAGVSVAIFGVHDIGRRPVTLYVVQDFNEPLHLEQVRTLHAIGVGGFRHGAVLRHLGQRLQRDMPGRRHLVVLLTDTASHYVAPGIDAYMRRELIDKRCANCQARARCPIEPLLPTTTIRQPQPDSWDMYYPTFYEMADLRKALEANRHIEPFLVLLDSGYSRGLLDRTVGKGRWFAYLSESELPQLIRAVSSVLARPEQAMNARSV